MAQLSAIVEFEIWFLLGALFFVVVYQMLNGRINSRELLLDKDDGTVSPVRVQSPVLAVLNAAITREADNALELPTTRARAQATGDRGERRRDPPKKDKSLRVRSASFSPTCLGGLCISKPILNCMR